MIITKLSYSTKAVKESNTVNGWKQDRNELKQAQGQSNLNKPEHWTLICYMYFTSYIYLFCGQSLTRFAVFF